MFIFIETVEVAFFVTGFETLQIQGVEIITKETSTIVKLVFHNCKKKSA
jgi:hypothetical protein